MKRPVVLPFFGGITLCAALYFTRIFDDIPGLPLLILILSFLLLYYGACNARKIKKESRLVIIAPLFFGAAGLLWTALLFLNGELRESPGVFVVFNALHIGFLFVGVFNIKKVKQRINPGVFVPLFYCACGVLLALVLPFDGEITTIQRITLVLAFIFTGCISLAVIRLIRKRRAYPPPPPKKKKNSKIIQFGKRQK